MKTSSLICLLLMLCAYNCKSQTVSFSGLNTRYCVTASPVTLTGIPSGGDFSGVGITGNTFSPSVAGTGGPYTITYSYTDSIGNTNTASHDVTIADTRAAAADTIYGPGNTCPFVTTDTTLTYHIQPVPGASSYQWSVPDSVILISGQGDTVIHVKFLAGYVRGYLYVNTISACGYSDSTKLWVERLSVHVPGGISGPSDVCNYIGTSVIVNYYLSNISYVQSLNWTVPAGVTIISGQTDSVLKVTYSGSFTTGRISVVGSNECSSFSRTTILITRDAPDKPVRINGPSIVCEYVDKDTLIRYYVEAAPRTTSYNWVLPTGITLMSGQGDTAIYVKFLSSFVTGTSIGVSSVAACGSSPAAILYLNKKYPVIPVLITGPTDPCPLMNTSSTATYSIIPTMYSTSYSWSVPAGATIISGQGDINLVVQYDSSFISGNISVTAVNNCGTSAARTLAITRKLPAVPGTMSGPIDACPLMNTSSTAVYSISPVANSTSYIWNVPAGASIVSGQGDTLIQVSYNSSFISGAVTVTAVNNCASSTIRSLTISKKLAAQPASITGITDACPISGTTTNATYTIKKVLYATSYSWTVSTGATIISGQGDTTIQVNFNSSFSTGTIAVTAVTNCSSSAARSLAVTAKAPLVPTVINGPANVCSYVTNISTATYTVGAVTGANHYSWTVTAGMTILSAATDSSSVGIVFSDGFTTGTLSVKAVAGCGSSAAKTLALVTVPAKPTSISASAPACKSTTVSYKAADVSGATSYTWTVPVNATLLSGAGSDSITVSFSSVFTSGAITVKTNSNCGTSLATSLTVSSAGCSARMNKSAAMKTTGIEVVTIAGIAPNPSNGNFKISILTANHTDNARIQVVDFFGRVVLDLKGINNNGFIAVSVTGNTLPAGIYTVRSIIGKETTNIKMVIQK